MIQRFRKWIRIVLPADWTIGIFFGVLACAYVSAIVRSSLGYADAWTSLFDFRAFWIMCAAMLYAFFRTLYFHPIENRPYGIWLINSPWRYPDPLPNGPLGLVWQDAAVIGVLTAIYPINHDSLSFLWVPTAFLLAYSLPLGYCHWKAGITWVDFAVAVPLGVFALVFFSPIARLLVAGLIAAEVSIGTQQMLKAFPFTNDLREWLKLAPESYDRDACIGWPTPPQIRRRWSWNISHWQSATLSIAIGWLYFCGAHHFRDTPEFVELFQTLYLWIAVFFVCGRLYVYLRGYAPPVSLLGRIATGRLIIPGYDVTLAAPLVTAVVAYLMPRLMISVGVHPATAFPIAATIVAWLALALPPRLEDWQLTGHHRIAYRFLAALGKRSQTRSQP